MAVKRKGYETIGLEVLVNAAKTYAERRKLYGRNHDAVSKSLLAMFPGGIELRTEADFKRFYIFALLVMKLGRYAKSFFKGGHQDSIHDTVVYAAILEAIDEETNNARPMLRHRNHRLSGQQNTKTGKTSGNNRVLRKSRKP